MANLSRCFTRRHNVVNRRRVGLARSFRYFLLYDLSSGQRCRGVFVKVRVSQVLTVRVYGYALQDAFCQGICSGWQVAYFLFNRHAHGSFHLTSVRVTHMYRRYPQKRSGRPSRGPSRRFLRPIASKNRGTESFVFRVRRLSLVGGLGGAVVYFSIYQDLGDERRLPTNFFGA